MIKVGGKEYLKGKNNRMDNNINVIEIEYIRASRTIETIVVRNNQQDKLLYIYNYEGNSFRCFGSLLSLVQFFEEGKEPEVYFESETELDEFLGGQGTYN